MNILTKFGSNCPSGLREEDEKQTKPFYTPLDLLFLLCPAIQLKKTINFLKNNLMNIPIKIGSQYGCFESCQFRSRSVFFVSCRLKC